MQHNFTRYMKLIMSVLQTEPLDTGEIVRRIEAEHGYAIARQQLTGPLIQLRQHKWVKRKKHCVGEKQVGHATYPVFERRYWVPQDKLALYEFIGPQFDGFERVEVLTEEMVTRARSDLALSKAEPSAAHFMADVIQNLRDEGRMDEVKLQNAVVGAVFDASIEHDYMSNPEEILADLAGTEPRPEFVKWLESEQDHVMAMMNPVIKYDESAAMHLDHLNSLTGEMERVRIPHLAPTTKLQLSPAASLDYDAFAKKLLTDIAESYGIPYEQLSHKMDQAYSASRLYAEAMKEEREMEEWKKTAEAYERHKERFFQWSMIHDRENLGVPYMLRVIAGRLRFHIFWRGDEDKDPHDHPWQFWTFPLTSYVEEYFEETALWDGDPDKWVKRYRVVRAFRWHHREATFVHRVIGRWNGRAQFVGLPHEIDYDEAVGNITEISAKEINAHPEFWFPLTNKRRIYTIVWRGHFERHWGFWKKAERWCWNAYRYYIWEGGKTAACAEDPREFTVPGKRFPKEKTDVES